MAAVHFTEPNTACKVQEKLHFFGNIFSRAIEIVHAGFECFLNITFL